MIESGIELDIGSLLDGDDMSDSEGQFYELKSKTIIARYVKFAFCKHTRISRKRLQTDHSLCTTNLIYHAQLLGWQNLSFVENRKSVVLGQQEDCPFNDRHVLYAICTSICQFLNAVCITNG